MGPRTLTFDFRYPQDARGSIRIYGGKLAEEGLEGFFSRDAWELPPPEAAPDDWWEKRSGDERLNVRTIPPEWIQSSACHKRHVTLPMECQRRHGLHELDMWRWWIQKVTLSSSSVERDLQASWQTCGRPSALTWSICTTCWS
ncbi:unnamed protein product [Cladocopium goreaui]|uniref:Uncharacterized protein n=1 Tax=Cladocopium goreaui TaxID=2562237 RepID=A0A9P1M3L4_9DINO|nr:unnamed protein product [Cladocopium goreaui]